MVEMSDKSKSIKTEAFADFLRSGCDLNHKSDVEVLRMLLCDCFHDQKSIGELSERMICECGSIRAVFYISDKKLKDDYGFTNSDVRRLSIVRAFFHKAAMQRYEFPIPTDSEKRIYEFLRDFYLNSRKEEIHILTLDSDREITGAYLLNEGEESSAEINVGNVIKMLKEKAAYGSYILTHNHPDCNNSPTSGDRQTTTFVYYTTKESGYIMCAHYIFGDNGLNFVPINERYSDYLFLKKI